jgi:putative ABC transport system ATP-binding protein
MIYLDQISKTYYPAGRSGGDEDITVTALRNITLEITAGSYVVLIGTNGSGKSTLLNVLAGGITPDSGKILLQNEDVTQHSSWQRSRHIARIFQNPMTGTAPDLSILENFRLAALRTQSKGLQIGTGKAFRNRVAETISRLNMGLEKKLDRPIGSLSGGQRQALALLMSTMDECRILLMDEPCSALDPRSSQVIMELADQLIREKKITALLVTHQLRDCIQYGDRVLLMHEGAIKEDFSGDKKKELTIEQLYRYF